jgi:hypothetical protein
MSQALIDNLKELSVSVQEGGKAEALFLWEWDDYMKMVLSKLPQDLVKPAEDLLSGIFPHKFRDKDLKKASPRVAEIAEECGGLRSGQILFCGDPDQPLVLTGLWWPWGDGVTVSIRIGILASGGSLDSEELQETIRDWFDL